MATEPDPFKDENWRDWPEAAQPAMTQRPVIPPDSPGVRHIRPPAPGQFLDWGYAAAQLAAGQSVEEVARLLGCPPTRIWRNLKRSRKFRARIQMAHDRLTLQTTLRFRQLGERTVSQIERHSEKLDARALLWLAEKLNLGAVPSLVSGIGGWYGDVATPKQRK